MPKSRLAPVNDIQFLSKTIFNKQKENSTNNNNNQQNQIRKNCYLNNERMPHTNFNIIYRLRRNRWITFMHCDGRCTATSRRKPPRLGATQHRHFQRHHSKIGGAQSQHDFADRFQSRGHSDIRCMEIERFARESRHRIGHQSRFFALPFSDVTTIEHCTDIVSRLDYR